MAGFATADDVADVLKRTFTLPESDWVELLLAQSADYLRGVIGQHVYPPQTVTFTAYPLSGRVDLPQSYVSAIVSVTVEGVDVPWRRFEDSILGLDRYQAVEVTFSYGAEEPPQDLVGLNIAMVSSAITLVENDLGVSVGGLSSLALDDFKIAFAEGGDKTGHLTLPTLTEENLRRSYGASSGTGETR